MCFCRGAEIELKMNHVGHIGYLATVLLGSSLSKNTERNWLAAYQESCNFSVYGVPPKSTRNTHYFLYNPSVTISFIDDVGVMGSTVLVATFLKSCYDSINLSVL